MSADYYGSPDQYGAEPQKKSRPVWITVIIVLIVLCCCCILIGGLSMVWLWNYGDQLIEELSVQLVKLLV